MSNALDLKTVEHYREEIAHRRIIKCQYVERVPLDFMDALLVAASDAHRRRQLAELESLRKFVADLPKRRPWYVRLFARAPDFVIGPTEDPYLLRWWIIPRNPVFNIYLHKIIRSDDDRALHDHPWWNVSILLRGGYREITPVAIYKRKPGSIVARFGKALHRLEVDYGTPAWSLFITGPRFRTWGFACPKGWVRWQDFTGGAKGELVGRGCGEMS